MTRAQLLAQGISRRTVDNWLADGRLIAVHRGVYAVGHIPTHPLNRAHAALLAAGEQSALAGASAMVLWRLWKRWPDPYELVIAGNRRPSGLLVHQTKTLLSRDITSLEGLRVTSPARTLLDMAPRLTAKQLARAVNDLRLRDNALTLPALADIIARNPRHRAVTLLRPHLEHGQAEPTRSELEDAFRELIRKHRLPTPEINVHVGSHRVDAFYRDQRLIIELDGWAWHKTRAAFVRDRRQDAEILAATGIPTVRLTYDDTTRTPSQTAGRLRMLLERQPHADLGRAQ